MRNQVSKIISIAILFLLFLTVSTKISYAHVVVSPDQAGISSFQTFTVGVPNEKDASVVGLRLSIPNGLNEVYPNVKPGWTIEIKKSGSGNSEKVTEIDWTGGTIPSSQRDDFLFSAQVPSDETTLNWKAYQTYQDGSVVSWDQASAKNLTDEQREKMESEGKGPYSQTKVINDLKASGTTSSDDKSGRDMSIQLSIIALALSAVAVVVSFRKK